MYEHFKNELLNQLDGKMTSQQLYIISVCMDKISVNYNVTKAETALSIVGHSEFANAIKLYLIVKTTQGTANSSIEVERIILNKWCNTTTVPLDKLTANVVRAWLYNYQQMNNISNRTLDLYRTVICCFLKWCYAEGYLEKNIVQNVKPIKFSRKPRLALTQMELEKVRAACKDEREKCIIQVLYSTGCRVTELINIKLKDVNWQTKQIMVIGKGSKYRTVFLNAKAEFAITNYLKNRKFDSEFLLCNERGGGQMTKGGIERIFKCLSQAAGFDKGTLTPHIMRHTMATQAITVCPVEQVQQMLGHSSINTTMIYAEVKPQTIKASHKIAVI